MSAAFDALFHKSIWNIKRFCIAPEIFLEKLQIALLRRENLCCAGRIVE